MTFSTSLPIIVTPSCPLCTLYRTHTFIFNNVDICVMFSMSWPTYFYLQLSTRKKRIRLFMLWIYLYIIFLNFLTLTRHVDIRYQKNTVTYILGNPYLKEGIFEFFHEIKYYHDRKIENFNTTNDGKSCEESHGASNCWQHINKFCCSVFSYFVKSGSIKIDSHKSEIVLPFVIWMS